jgi:MFS family permease
MLPSAPQPRAAPSVGSAVLICCIVNLNEAVASNMLFSYLSFLVGSFGVKRVDTGLYVGLLASAYFLGQTLTVRTWGALSDRYGRRPILLFGLLGSLITSVWFGLAQSYEEALAARFLCGVLTNAVSLCKVYVGEVTSKATQATGFSMLSLTWGLGILFAPALGGFLADPAALYPGTTLDTPLLRHYRYLLPSLVSAGFAALCLALALPLLKETAQWQRRNAAASASAGGTHAAVATSEPEDEGTGTALEVEGGSDGSGGSELSDSDLEGSDEGEAAPLTSSGSSASAAATAAAAAAAATTAPPPPPSTAAAAGGRGAAAAPLPPEAEGTPSKSKGDTAAAAAAAGSAPPPLPSTITAASSSLAICLDPALSPAIAAYATLAALQILFDELMPVFSSTDPALGGWGGAPLTLAPLAWRRAPRRSCPRCALCPCCSGAWAYAPASWPSCTRWCPTFCSFRWWRAWRPGRTRSTLPCACSCPRARCSSRCPFPPS